MSANYNRLISLDLYKFRLKNNNLKDFLLLFLYLISFILLSKKNAFSQYINIKGENYSILNNTFQETSKNQHKFSKISNIHARYGLTYDGLSGLFSTETAEKIKTKKAIGSVKLEYHEITSHRGKGLRAREKGNALTTILSFNYLGDWAEWSVSVPIHKYELAAPFTFNSPTKENSGIGNLKLAWKATYLPDKSYYRYAYGTVLYLTVGNSYDMAAAGSKEDDEIKIFGTVSTKETDYATAHLQLGAIINSSSIDNRFIYSFGLTYDVTHSVAFIGEFSGEIQGDNDKDSLDMILGFRLLPSNELNLEFSYTKNLRTYRPYGYDERFHTGINLYW